MTAGAACPHGTARDPDDRVVPRPAPRPPAVRGLAAGRFVPIGSAAAARRVLRARGATTQAGFTAEHIPSGRLRRHPVLLSDGPRHDAQRAELGRFFAPRVIETRVAARMAERADALLGAKPPSAACSFDALALRYSVEVSAPIVGLTSSPSARLARRLDAFFRQPGVDMSRDDLGRSPWQWALAAWRGVVPLARFHFGDVRPAIRARRTSAAAGAPADDIIGRMLAKGCSELEILVECVTYGTAGMVTTREFLSLAAWRLVGDPALGRSFLAADRQGRLDLLAELLRLDPVIGRLYRRVTAPIPGEEPKGGDELATGDLVEIRVDEANADAVFGPRPLALDPAREVAPGYDPAGFAFGDGAHRCPGRHLALLQAEALLSRLLALGPELVRPPRVAWSELLGGYALRGLVIRWRDDGGPRDPVRDGGFEDLRRRT